jgi:nicotinamidase-related amidase
MSVNQSSNVRHIAIDMQRLFAERTDWYSPSMMTILPNVLRLSSALRGQTLYARFTVPRDAEEAHGCWRDFYRRWSTINSRQLRADMIDLVAPLAELATPEQIFDKPGYSIFSSPALDTRLRDAMVDTLILSGVETDVCVYSSVLSAIDLGYSVVLASDALASPDDEAHRAVLLHLAPRLPEQIKIMTTDEILHIHARIAARSL